VYVEKSVVTDEAIVFTAGTQREAIRMRYDDFVHLARPVSTHSLGKSDAK
jgi:prolyl-tRNA editing enzyme YbaK/EbsC (Cys-tRNA(Pro) deacylase)